MELEVALVLTLLLRLAVRGVWVTLAGAAAMRLDLVFLRADLLLVLHGSPPFRNSVVAVRPLDDGYARFLPVSCRTI
jgi:hypothetical protein